MCSAQDGMGNPPDTGDIYSGCAKEVRIYRAPALISMKSENAGTDNKDEVSEAINLQVSDAFKAGASRISRPCHHNKEIEKEPPRGEKQHVQLAVAQDLAHFPRVRSHRQRSDERNRMQEKNNVQKCGSIADVVQDERVVGPNELASEPQRAAKGKQHPEIVLPAIGRGSIPQQAGIRKEGYQAKGNVGNGSARRTGRHQQRNQCESADEDNPSDNNYPS